MSHTPNITALNFFEEQVYQDLKLYPNKNEMYFLLENNGQKAINIPIKYCDFSEIQSSNI